MSQKKHDIDKLISGWGIPDSQSQEEAWNRLMKKTQQQQPIRKVNFQWTKWAAAVAAVFVLVFLGLSQFGAFAPHESNLTFIAQNIYLPDSSLVKLKTHSSVKYNYRMLDGARIIHLKGEALFDVKKGKTFEVKFPGGKLKVLGTEFNIQAYSENSGRIDCYRGAVKLVIHDKDYILKKGKSLTFDQTSVDGPFSFDPETKIKLPDNTYSWNNRPLKEILMLICQRENYTLDAPDKILNKRFTGQLKLGNNDQSIRILSRAMNFDFQLKSGKLQIFEKE